MFIGMIFAGESILIPSLALALAGKLNISYVISLALFATLFADFLWYIVGIHIHNTFSQRIIGSKVHKQIERISGVFSNKEATVLFLSKFVYGTRIAVQILAGIKHMKIGKYIIVNLSGTATVIVLISFLVYFIDTTVIGIENLLYKLGIVLLVTIIITILGHIIFGKYIQKKWFQ